MEVNMQKSGDNVPCPHENRIRISDLLFASTLMFLTDIAKIVLSLRITVLDELRLCLLICSTEGKTGLQQHHVKICKYGIFMEYGRFVPFHTSNLSFHSTLKPFHIPYRFFPSIPYSIPYHSMPCPISVCLRRYLCVKTVLNLLLEISRFRIV